MEILEVIIFFIVACAVIYSIYQIAYNTHKWNMIEKDIERLEKRIDRREE